MTSVIPGRNNNITCFFNWILYYIVGEQSARHTPDAPPDYMHTMMEKSLEKLEKLDKLDHVIRLLEKVDSRLDDMDNKIDKLEKWISKRD